MTKFTLNNKNYLAVDVPEGTYKCKLTEDSLMCKHDKEQVKYWDTQHYLGKVSHNTHIIIGIAKDLDIFGNVHPINCEEVEWQTFMEANNINPNNLILEIK